MTQQITVEAGFVESAIDTEDKAIDILQPVMDVAYDKYQANPHWSFGDFLMHLDVRERCVVAIGKLNHQVCNGGFIQWRDNGYDDRSEFLMQALDAVGTDTAKEVKTLVNRALEVNTDLDCDDYEDEEFEYERMSGDFEPLDDRFYELNERLLCDTTRWWLSK